MTFSGHNAAPRSFLAARTGRRHEYFGTPATAAASIIRAAYHDASMIDSIITLIFATREMMKVMPFYVFTRWLSRLSYFKKERVFSLNSAHTDGVVMPRT